MTRLFFVVNALDELSFAPLVARYLADCTLDVGTSMPPAPEEYRLVVLWSYRKIIRPLPATGNVILFHSSDLPRGRGWSPIYHALVDGDSHFTVSGILAAAEVDSGNIVVKARLPILPHYTASDLRRFDCEISVLLISQILRRFAGRVITGVPQQGSATYRPRRTPADSRFDLSKPFSQLIGHLRACEPEHPAFFDLNGARYLVRIESLERAELPTELSIEFAESSP